VYTPKLLRGLVGALLLAPWIAHSASLGNLTVRSSLGQPLLAEIDLFSVGKEEASTLDVRLGSQDAYRQADMQYGAALTGMRLSVEKRPNGSFYVRAVSSRPVSEPFLNLVVELNSSAGRFTRQYTALIDPPGYTPPQAAAVAPAPPPSQAEARPAPPRPEPKAVATPAPGGSKQYGPVKRGDTLGKIAASVKPEGISLEQMLVGIFRSNPDAFINNNMNLIRAGATLQIPDNEQVAGIQRRDAAQEIRVQANDWNRYRRRLSDRPATATERDQAAPKREPRVKVEDKAAGEKGKDVLRLSKGQPGGKKGKTIEDRVQALEEELIARERALNEANQRIKDLEKSVKQGAK
jgi:pilus assembly protein FimV